MAGKLCEPLLKQSSYKKELFTSLEEIKKHTDRIKEEATQCLHMRLLAQGKQLQATQQNSEQGLNYLQSMYFILRDITKTNNLEAPAHFQWFPLPRRLGPEADSESIPNDTSSLQNDLEEPVTIKEHHAQTNQSIKVDSLQTMNRLLSILRHDTEATRNDIDRCLRLAYTLDERGKAKAAALVENENFERFMAEDLSSSSLLVNGHCDPSSIEGLSPLSPVAARLAKIGEQAGSAFVASYLCDQHRPYSQQSSWPPPVVMMASLVGQLLSQMIERQVEVDLSFLSNSQWKQLEQMDLSMLCIVFRDLTNKLPPKTIFVCILDEVNRYETAVFSHDTEAVLRRLTRLVEKCDNIIFKLLVTCSGRALGISQYFTGCSMDLKEAIEVDDAAMWRIAAMGHIPTQEP